VVIPPAPPAIAINLGDLPRRRVVAHTQLMVPRRRGGRTSPTDDEYENWRKLVYSPERDLPVSPLLLSYIGHHTWSGESCRLLGHLGSSLCFFFKSPGTDYCRRG